MVMSMSSVFLILKAVPKWLDKRTLFLISFFSRTASDFALASANSLSILALGPMAGCIAEIKPLEKYAYEFS